MPYIPKSGRELLNFNIPAVGLPGELNYCFTVLIKKYIELNGENYRTYNDIVGALESCKLELYRRKIADYENEKIEENGDVF